MVKKKKDLGYYLRAIQQTTALRCQGYEYNGLNEVGDLFLGSPNKPFGLAPGGQVVGMYNEVK